MISLEINDAADSSWNERLIKSQLGTIFQTQEYAKYLELQTKVKPIFLKFVGESGSIVGQLLAFQSFKGKTRIETSFGKGILSDTILKIGKLLPKHIRWSYGPIIFEETYNDEIIKSFSIWLKSIENFYGSLHPLDSKFDFLPQFNFIKKTNSTFVIDLQENIETIFKKTNKNSVQKNIRRSEERGVTVTSMTSKNDIIEYYNLQKSYRDFNNLKYYSIEDITEAFNLLGSLGFNGFIARVDNIPVGAVSFFSFNGYINESGIARTEIDFEKKLYSQDLLRWKIIEWGKEHNCKYYDLSGIKLKNQTPKEIGIFQNKKKWGGNLINYKNFSNSN